MSKRMEKEKPIDQKGDGADEQHTGLSPKHHLGIFGVSSKSI